MRLLALAAVLPLAGCGKFSYTLSISKETIQQKVDPMFPVDLKKEADLPFAATLSAGEIILDSASEQIGMRISFQASPPPAPPTPPAPPDKPAGGPPRPPFAPPGGNAAGELVEGVVSIVGELSYDPAGSAFYFQNPRVRQLEAGEMPEPLATALSKAVEKLAGRYLSAHAIHTLDGDQLPAKAARALLKSVQVEDGAMQVTIGF